MQKNIGDVLEKLMQFVQWRKYSSSDDRGFLRAYAEDTDRRVKLDPKWAIGGHWEEIGRLQFEFLKEQGLAPRHSLLDIGCGTLRAGRFFIEYLDTGNYLGFDMSREAIRAGHELVADAGLTEKDPTLVHSPDSALDFGFVDRQFDFVLAQSVFTHLRASIVEQCFQNIRKVMKRGGHFFFTYEDKHLIPAPLAFAYDRSFFVGLAAANGMRITELTEYEERHLNRQKMLAAEVV